MAVKAPQRFSKTRGGGNRPWQVAVLLLRDFSGYRQDFQTITGGARARFEASDWLGAQTAARARIQLYSQFQSWLSATFNPIS